jgi:hypothetical protein
MRYLLGMQVGKAICDAIGIDPRLVVHMTIRIPAGGAVEIEIESVATEVMADGLAKELANIVKTYRLVEKEDE